MEDEPTSLREVRCARCCLPSYIPATDTVSWCGFCQEYADLARAGPVQVWRLPAGNIAEPCDPARLGNWVEAGRKNIAWTNLVLRDGTDAVLMTWFLCVDPLQDGEAPLLFRTSLAEMHSRCEFDGLTRSYATFADAMSGHAAVLSHLRTCDAVIRS